MTATTNLYGRDLRLAQLEYARETLSTGSFSAAARQCHVSQPALSSGIATLEATLGVQLFERSTTGAIPTAAGQRLLPIMGAILGTATELFAASRQLADNQSSLRLGVSPLISPAVIATTFDAFRTKARNVEVAFSEANLEQLRSDLTAGHLDVIIVPKVKWEIPGTTRITIATEALHHVGKNRDPATEKIQLRDLADRTLVVVTEDCGLTEVTRTVLRSIGAEMKTHDARATSYQRLIEWADLGLGDAFVPASRVPPGRASSVVVNADQPVTIDFEAIWKLTPPAHEIIAPAVHFMTSAERPSDTASGG